MGTAIKHPVPDRVKPSFVIFDIRALWRSATSVRVPGCQKLQMTVKPVWTRMLLHSCTHTATVGVKGLSSRRLKGSVLLGAVVDDLLHDWMHQLHKLPRSNIFFNWQFNGWGEWRVATVFCQTSRHCRPPTVVTRWHRLGRHFSRRFNHPQPYWSKS